MLKNMKSMLTVCATLAIAGSSFAANEKLAVNLAPDYAPVNGAKWSIDGGTSWNNAGASIDVAAGTEYTVTFNSATSGWAGAETKVTVATDEVKAVDVTLSPVPGFWGAHTIRAGANGGTFTVTANGVESEFVDNGTKKIGFGTRDFNGMTLAEFSGLKWERPDGAADTDYSVYFNVWVTDKAGKYALLSMSRHYEGITPAGQKMNDVNYYQWNNEAFRVYEGGALSVANYGWMTPEFHGLDSTGNYPAREAGGNASKRLVLADIAHLTIDTPPANAYPATVGTGASKAGYGVYIVLAGGPGAAVATPKTVSVANAALYPKYSAADALAAGEWVAMDANPKTGFKPSIRPQGSDAYNFILDYAGSKTTVFNKGLLGMPLSDFGKLSFTIANPETVNADMWPAVNFFISTADDQATAALSAQVLLDSRSMEFTNEAVMNSTVYAWGRNFPTSGDYTAFGAVKVGNQLFKAADGTTPLKFSDLTAQGCKFVTGHPWYGATSVQIDFGHTGDLGQAEMIKLSDAKIVRGYKVETASIPAGDGTITAPAVVPAGENFDVVTIPAAGKKIKELKLDGVAVPAAAGSVTSYTLTLTAVEKAYSVEAVFEDQTFEVVPTATVGGTYDPSTTQTVIYGGDVAFTFTASAGYKLVDVKADSVSVGAVATYTFPNVTANHTISAEFALIAGDLTVNVDAGAWSVDNGATWKNSGDKVTLPATDYVVIFQGVDGKVAPKADVVTITDEADVTKTYAYADAVVKNNWATYGTFLVTSGTTSHITADADNNIYLGGYGHLIGADNVETTSGQANAAVLVFPANGKTAPTVEQQKLISPRIRTFDNWNNTSNTAQGTNGYLGLSKDPITGKVFLSMDGNPGSPCFTTLMDASGAVDATWNGGNNFDYTNKVNQGSTPRYQGTAVLEDGTLLLSELFVATNKSIRFVKRDGTTGLIKVAGMVDHVRDMAAYQGTNGAVTIFCLANAYKSVYRLDVNMNDLSKVYTARNLTGILTTAGSGGIYYNAEDNTLIHANGSESKIYVYNADNGTLKQTIAAGSTRNDAVVIKTAAGFDQMFAASSDRNVGVFVRSASIQANADGAGAKFSVDNGATWTNVGTALTGLLAGQSYTVKFSTVDGYITPADATVVAAEVGVTTVTATYTKRAATEYEALASYANMFGNVSAARMTIDKAGNIYVGGYGQVLNNGGQNNMGVDKFAPSADLSTTPTFTTVAPYTMATGSTNGYMGLASTPDGGVLFTADFGVCFTVKLKADGTTDTAFATNGVYDVLAQGARYQGTSVFSNGKILLPGLVGAAPTAANGQTAVLAADGKSTVALTVTGMANHVRDTAIKNNGDGTNTIYFLQGMGAGAGAVATVAKATVTLASLDADQAITATLTTMKETVSQSGAYSGLFYNAYDDTLLLASSKDNKLYVYDAATETLKYSYDAAGVNDAVVATVNGTQVIYAVGNKSLYVFGDAAAVASTSVDFGVDAPAGASWSVNGGAAWNTAAASLLPGTYTVTFKAIEGYITPAAQTITLAAGEILALNAAYTEIKADVTVNFNVADVAAGGWMLMEGAPSQAAVATWNASGYTEAALAFGKYTVTFKEVAGWTKPEDILVDVAGLDPIVIDAAYTKVATLVVTSNVESATWSVNGTDWFAVGTSKELALGTYSVKFSDVAGYTTPADVTVTLASNKEVKSVSGEYVKLVGAALVTISPAEAVAEGAKWMVNGTEYGSGEAALNLAPGTYTVSFKVLSNWAVTPAPVDVTVEAGKVATAAGTYAHSASVIEYFVF